MKTIALVDFDRTLYKKDSLIEFTRFYKGNLSFYMGMIYLSPFLILMKLGLLTNENAKKRYFSYFFKNEDYNHFLEKGKEFAETRISNDLNQQVYNSLLKHIDNNDFVYIVTASFSEWIAGWSEKKNIKIISTKPEIINNKITGNFSSKNCNGIEKVNRIENEIVLSQYDKIYVYGHGKGDFEMLKLRK